MAKVHDAGDPAKIFDTNISHYNIASAHMCTFPGKQPSQPAPQKRMTWNSAAKFISKKKKKYGLHFLKQIVTLIMLMNHSVAQPCRVLRFAQAATFTAQFLNDTSVTSVLANDDVLKLLKLGTAHP